MTDETIGPVSSLEPFLVEFQESMTRTFPEQTEVTIAIDGRVWKHVRLSRKMRVSIGFYPQ